MWMDLQSRIEDFALEAPSQSDVQWHINPITIFPAMFTVLVTSQQTYFKHFRPRRATGRWTQLTLFQVQLIKCFWKTYQYGKFLSSCLLFLLSLRYFCLWLCFPLIEPIQVGNLIRLRVLFSMWFLYSSHRPYSRKFELTR